MVETEDGKTQNAQNHLHRMLWREQKRSERSQNHLLLLVIDVKPALVTEDDVKLLRRVIDRVNRSVRDTDLSGWYEANAIFVVLFTELGDSDIHAATNAIRTKVAACLQNSLTADQLNKISVSFHPFPDHWDGNLNSGAKYAWDTRCDSDRSLAVGISSISRDHRIDSHSACAGADIANPAFRAGQSIAEEMQPAISGQSAILATEVTAST